MVWCPYHPTPQAALANNADLLAVEQDKDRLRTSQEHAVAASAALNDDIRRLQRQVAESDANNTLLVARSEVSAQAAAEAKAKAEVRVLHTTRHTRHDTHT